MVTKDRFGVYFSRQTFINLPFPLESVAAADGYRSQLTHVVIQNYCDLVVQWRVKPLPFPSTQTHRHKLAMLETKLKVRLHCAMPL